MKIKLKDSNINSYHKRNQAKNRFKFPKTMNWSQMNNIKLSKLQNNLKYPLKTSKLKIRQDDLI